ncbi:phosphotransferase [Empedobacter tilapiae]
MKMHNNEVTINEDLVKKLIQTQFPEYSNLKLEKVQSFGTDNVLFRLGEKMLARFPKIDWAIGQIEKEIIWMPRLAEVLPVRIPNPLKLGIAQDKYPWNWGIYEWIIGNVHSIYELKNNVELVYEISHFLSKLQEVNSEQAPIFHDYKYLLKSQNEKIIIAIDACRSYLNELSIKKIQAIWQLSINLPSWGQNPIWTHGDLHSSNLLFREEKLYAILDFSQLQLNDPAVDLTIAWNTFDEKNRKLFHEILTIDENTWLRGRAYALMKALYAIPYYQNTNPEIIERSYFTLQQILEEVDIFKK